MNQEIYVGDPKAKSFFMLLLNTAKHEGKIIYTNIDMIISSGNGYIVSIPLVRYQSPNKNIYISFQQLERT